MTPEAQNIAIAKACGWKWMARKGQPTCRWLFSPTEKPRYDIDTWWLGRVVGEFEPCEPPENKIGLGFGCKAPSYVTDLNDMYEAIETMTWQDRTDMEMLVIEMLPMDGHTFHAKADVLSVAFLKTLGLWEEEKCEVYVWGTL